MFVTNHVIAGAAIGGVVNQPVPAFLLGVASHFAMDMLPHWGGIQIDDPRFMRIARTDGITGLAMMATMAIAAGDRRPSVIAGMVGAALPDLDKPADVFLGFVPFPKRWQRFHVRIQNEKMDRWGREIVFAATAGAATAALLHYASKHR